MNLFLTNVLSNHCTSVLRWTNAVYWSKWRRQWSTRLDGQGPTSTAPFLAEEKGKKHRNRHASIPCGLEKLVMCSDQEADCNMHESKTIYARPLISPNLCFWETAMNSWSRSDHNCSRNSSTQPAAHSGAQHPLAGQERSPKRRCESLRMLYALRGW